MLLLVSLFNQSNYHFVRRHFTCPQVLPLNSNIIQYQCRENVPCNRQFHMHQRNIHNADNFQASLWTSLSNARGKRVNYSYIVNRNNQKAKYLYETLSSTKLPTETGPPSLSSEFRGN